MVLGGVMRGDQVGAVRLHLTRINQGEEDMYLTEVCLYKCGNICQSVSVMFIQMQLATAEIYTGVVRSGKSSAL